MPTESIRTRSAVKQRRSGDQRHPERHDAEVLGRGTLLPANIKQVAHGEGEQNQSSSDLEIRHRDSERLENQFPEKHEPNRDCKGRPDAEEGFLLAALRLDVGAEPDENRHHPDGVDRHKDRNESDDKLGGEIFHERSLRRSGEIQRSNRFTTSRIYTMLSAPSTIL